MADSMRLLYKTNSFSKHLAVVVIFSVFILFMYHGSSAEEITQVEAGEEVLGQNISTEENIVISQQEEIVIEEILESSVSTEEVPTSTSLEGGVVENSKEEDGVFIEIEPPTENEEDSIVYPFFSPENLPKVRALPEIKEFNTDPDAPHSCWVRDFSVDMRFDPTKNNILFINNPIMGTSTVEVLGLPQGFEIMFPNNSQSVTIPLKAKEIPFSIEKKGNPQDGDFNIVFVFTKKIGQDSTTTCQMNLVS